METYISLRSDHGYFTPLGRTVLLDIRSYVISKTVKIAVWTLILCLVTTAIIATVLSSGIVAVGLLMFVPAICCFLVAMRHNRKSLKRLLRKHPHFYEELCAAEEATVPIFINSEGDDHPVDPRHILRRLRGGI